jgi:hypothetical protein
MNSQPPFGDATDEAVSALLDDELDDFATAHGTTPEDARRELVSWSGFETRRAELQRARDTLQTTSAPLDTLDRHRLVRNAAAAGPAAHRPRRTWRAIAIAAAVVVVVGAAGFGLSQLGGSSSSSSSKASKAAGSIASASYVGDVGEIANPEVLRQLVSQQQAGLPTHAQGEFAPRATDGARTPAPTPSTTTTDAADAAAARDTATRCAKAIAGRDPVTFLAVGTYQGRAAAVVGVHRGTRTVAFVLDRSSCAVITAASL